MATMSSQANRRSSFSAEQRVGDSWRAALGEKCGFAGDDSVENNRSDMVLEDRAVEERAGLHSHPGRSSSDFEPMLDSEEAAALVKMHPKTLQKYARLGRVPAHRYFKRWRFRASELDAWVRAKVSSKSPLVP